MYSAFTMSNIKNHNCSEKCKGRQNCMASCFNCDVKFYMKCFGVDHSLLPKLNTHDSHIRFVCSNCLTKRKRNSLSTPSSTPVSTGASTPVSGVTSGARNGEFSEDIHRLNQNINELINKMQTPPNHHHVEQMERNTIVEQEAATKIDNIYRLLIKTSEILKDTHTKDNEGRNLSALMSLIENKFDELKKSSPSTNYPENDFLETNKVFNWSMQQESHNLTPVHNGRNSIIVKQSVDNDILAILKNSDKNNWDTLDAIRNELKNQSHTINEIKSLLHTHQYEPDLANVLSNRALVSSLVESIQLTSNNSMLDNTNFEYISSENILELDSSSSERHYGELKAGGNPIGMSFGPPKSNLSAEGLESGPTLNDVLTVCPNQINSPENDSFSSQSSSLTHPTTGNFVDMERLNQEAMTHNNIKNIVPESLKQNKQKRQIMPTLSVDKPGIGSDSTDATPPHNPLTGSTNAILSGVSVINTRCNQISLSTQPATNKRLNGEFTDKAPIDLESDGLLAMESLDLINNEVYVTKFDNNTTCDDIKRYINHQGSFDMDQIKIIRLTKRDQDVSMLSFVSFKIETNNIIAEKLL